MIFFEDVRGREEDFLDLNWAWLWSLGQMHLSRSPVNTKQKKKTSFLTRVKNNGRAGAHKARNHCGSRTGDLCRGN